SEVLFHLFLSFLHDAGTLDRASTEPSEVRAALRSSFSVVARFCAEEGTRLPPSNAIVACSQDLVAVHGAGGGSEGAAVPAAAERASAPVMAYRRYASRSDLERLFGDSELGRLRVADLSSARLSVVASDFEDDRPPSGWTRIDGAS